MALTLKAVLAELDRLSGDGRARSTRSDARRSSIPSPAPPCSARAATPASSSPSSSAAPPRSSSRGRASWSTRCSWARPWPARPTARTRRSASRRRGRSSRSCARWRTGSPPSSPTCPTPRLGPDAPPDVQDAAIAEVLERAIDAGQESVKRGPELLPVLREAGVVDAGGYALTIIFAGVVAALRGAEAARARASRPGPRHPSRSTSPRPTATARTSPSPATTSTTRASIARARGARRLRARRRRPHDAEGPRPHRRARARDRPVRGGREVSRLDVADMHEQVGERAERLARATAASRRRAARWPWSRARGCGALFEGLGVHTLDGGPTLNPSTYDLLAGIHDVPAEEVVVLPNSPNVIMAAERAAELSEKHVRVCPTRSQQAGLAVAVALEPGARRGGQRGVDGGSARRNCAPAPSRGRRATTRAGASGAGEAVGYVDEELVAWGEPDADAARRPVAARRRGGAGHLHRRRRRAARRRRRGALAPDGVELEHSVRRPAELVVAAGGGVATGAARERPSRRSNSSADLGPRSFATAEPLDPETLETAPVRWPRPSRLAAPLGSPSQPAAKGLGALGLETVGDLLEHLPRDRREARTVADAGAGRVGHRGRGGARRSARAPCAVAECGRSSRRPWPTPPAR